MKRWAIVGFVIAASLLVGIIVVVAVTAPRCGAFLLLTAVDEPATVVLDEAKVRDEAPRVAALLDRALAEGEVLERDDRTARAAHAYLLGGQEGTAVVEWRGEAVRVAMSTC